MATTTPCSCLLCKQEINVSQFKIHYNSKQCGLGKKHSTNVNKPRPTELKCEFCNKIYDAFRNYSAHTVKCAKNKDRKNYINGMTGLTGDLYPRKDYIPWNKGMPLDEIKLHYDGNFRQGIKEHTAETKNLLSIKACERLQKNSKYSKNIEYKPGVVLESSFEVRTAVILDELGIKWIKVRQGYIWNDAGKTRRYIPDFYLPKYDLFLDPKNDYLIKKDKVKIDSAMELNNIKVVVLSDAQISKEFIETLLL